MCDGQVTIDWYKKYSLDRPEQRPSKIVQKEVNPPGSQYHKVVAPEVQ